MLIPRCRTHATETARVEQRPEDFMDEEDMGEFGIAPRQLVATQDFRMGAKCVPARLIGCPRALSPARILTLESPLHFAGRRPSGPRSKASYRARFRATSLPPRTIPSVSACSRRWGMFACMTVVCCALSTYIPQTRSSIVFA